MSWVEYSAKRIISSVFLLFLTSIFIFLIIRLVPGDPAVIIAGNYGGNVEEIRTKLGLDQPVWHQFIEWFGLIVLEGDFGSSLITGKPVSELLINRYPRSIELAFAGMLITVLISFPAGIIGAVKRNTPLGYSMTVFSQVGVSIPNFWLGLMLILLFGKYLNILPPSGYVPLSESITGNLTHILLPALTIGSIRGAVVTRFLRSSILEELQKDYVRTERAFGHSEKVVIRKYVMKNSLIPVITTLGLQVGYTMGALVIIEIVFAYPGIGSLLINGISRRDYPVVQATLLVIVATFILVNLLVDIIYGYFNPRLRV